jgi:hypothetical protein
VSLMGDRRSTLASECTSEVAASRKFTEIPGMTGSGRQPPNRVHASAHFSVSGNGNFVPTPAFYLPLILVVTVLQETTQSCRLVDAYKQWLNELHSAF